MHTETMQGRRRLYAILATGMAILLGSAGAAFACSAQPRVGYSLSSGSAAPGETVVVKGSRVTSAVEIRWASVTGQQLATVAPSGEAFEVPVRVPDVAPGIYAMLLVTENEGVARTAIEVTAAPGAAPARTSAALWPTTAAAPADSSTDVNSIGLVLLAVGLVGLAGGSTVAATRRRRVPAGSQQ